MTPRDACTYPRPFPPGFADCPTYHNQLFVALTSGHEPLPAVRTCQFLEAGMTQAGHFYARCALGSPEDRREWLARMDAERLEALRELRRALSAAVAVHAERLWAIKGRQLAARAAHDEAAHASATAELAAAIEPFMSVVDHFLAEQADALAALSMPRDATRQLIRDLLEAMVVSRTAPSGRFSAPPEILDQFPPEVRALFRPYEASVRDEAPA